MTVDQGLSASPNAGGEDTGNGTLSWSRTSDLRRMKTLLSRLSYQGMWRSRKDLNLQLDFSEHSLSERADYQLSHYSVSQSPRTGPRILSTKKEGLAQIWAGAGGRLRTPDLLITNQPLCQLSYTSIFAGGAAFPSRYGKIGGLLLVRFPAHTGLARDGKLAMEEGKKGECLSGIPASQVVEIAGFEPATLCLQSRCAPNCAIPPNKPGCSVLLRQGNIGHLCSVPPLRLFLYWLQRFTKQLI